MVVEIITHKCSICERVFTSKRSKKYAEECEEKHKKTTKKSPTLYVTLSIITLDGIRVAELLATGKSTYEPKLVFNMGGRAKLENTIKECK